MWWDARICAAERCDKEIDDATLEMSSSEEEEKICLQEKKQHNTDDL